MRALTAKERAEVLRRIRILKGKSQRELAKKAALTRETISHIEGGRTGLGPVRARRLAKALGKDAKERAEILKSLLLGE